MIGLPFWALSVMTDQVKANKGFIIKTNGDVVPFNPTVDDNGTMTYDIKTLKSACNFDYIEIVPLPNDIIMIVDEEGLLRSKPYNFVASLIYQAAYNDKSLGIVGDAILCHTSRVK